MKQFTLDYILQQPEDPKSARRFEYSGNAALVPALHWLRDGSWYVGSKDVAAFYDQALAPALGPFKSLPKEHQARVLDFSFQQMMLKLFIEPTMKQAALLYDDVFLISEFEVPESITTCPFDPSNPELQPLLSKGIGIPDVIRLPQHLLLGFAARVMAAADNKDRRLRMPGWRAERNFDHLKNVNHAINELAYLRWMMGQDAAFCILLPEHFRRVFTRKAGITCESFSCSPAACVLFPDLNAVPWDEVASIAKSSDCQPLKRALREWDAKLAEERSLNWRAIGDVLRPVVASLLNELDKARVTKTKAWVNLLVGLLPQPLGSVPNAVEVAKAYKRTIVPGLCRLNAENRATNTLPERASNK